MKHILTGILIATELLCIQPAFANDLDDLIYIPNDIVINDKGEAEVYVWLKTNVIEYNTIVMNLFLPEGFTILKNNNGKYIFNWNTEEVAPSHIMSYANNDEYIRLLGCSISNDYLLPGNHWLFNFTIQVPADFDSCATVSLRDIEFSEGTVRNHYFDNVDFVIRKDFEAEIEDNFVGSNGEDVIYNLQGIRVYTPLTTGYYIINGQKHFVNKSSK